MSGCRHGSRIFLPEFVSGQLKPEEAVLVENHLEGCSECLAEVEVIRELQGDTVPAPPPWFWTSLPGKVADRVDELRRSKRRRMVPVWAGGAAAAAAVLLFLLIPGQVSRDGDQAAGYPPVENTGIAFLSLEEQILSGGGEIMVDLDKPLAAELGKVSQEYMDSLDLVPGSGGYENMDLFTMRVFEGLLDEMIPDGVRKKVTS